MFTRPGGENIRCEPIAALGSTKKSHTDFDKNKFIKNSLGVTRKWCLIFSLNITICNSPVNKRKTPK